MARPYFTGNYGSALARVDTRPIIEAGKAQGQMYANMGAQIGGMIKEYGLNKEKRAKLTGEIEAYYEQNPEALSQIGMSGDEAKDKKDFTERERFVKGDMNMAQLEGYAGKLARGEVLQTKKANMELLRAQIEAQKENTLVSQENRDAQKSLRELQAETRERERNALNQYGSQIHQIQSELETGKKPEDLNSQDQWLYVNRVAILNGQMPAGGMIVPRDFRATSGQLSAAKEKTEAEVERIKGQTELTTQEVAEKKREADAAQADPEFASMQQVKTWEANLPPGVEANVEKHKDGWNAISLKVTSKDRVKDIPSVPGYPNYKIVGGYVYEGDPDKETLTKLGAEQPGRETELLIKVIGAMTTPDVEQYRKAKLRGTPSDDGKFFVFEDPVSGVEYRIPFNQDLEEKIAEIKRFEDQMKNSMPNTVDLRTR